MRAGSPVSPRHSLQIPVEEQAVAGRELLDSSEKGPGARDIAEREIFAEHLGVQGAWTIRVAQERLDLRCENEEILSRVVVHRFDSEPVSDEQQLFAPAVPDSESEHAAKVAHALCTVFLIGMNDRFCIGAGGELVAASDEIASEIGVVVDLAIENDNDRSVFIKDRLLSAAEVDDAQPSMAEADVVLDKITVIIRTAMRLSRCHALDEAALDGFSRVEVDDPANPAHKLSLRFLRVR